MSKSFRRDVVDAVNANSLERVKILVGANGGNIHVDLLNHLLVAAVDNKNFAMQQYAMDMGASGAAGIIRAAATGDMPMIELIENYHRLDMYSEALNQAVEHGNFDIAEWAIEAGAADMVGALLAAADNCEDSLGAIDWLIDNYKAYPTIWCYALEHAIRLADSDSRAREIAHLQRYYSHFEERLSGEDQWQLADESARAARACAAESATAEPDT